ncbi:MULTISPECIES: GNAT family N-acetyltransferase [Janthinobacterium]|uniref:GNAT family N-acetyltransferase n=1 Tax=Janthinobacterium TaxID=29580 RepID=UPI002E78CCCD|nr:GNAT family N-acetyltransferase [Janthinobacterium sp. EB271-G4-7A]
MARHFSNLATRRFIFDMLLKRPFVTFTPTQEDDADELVALRIEAMRDSLMQVGRFDPVRARERFLSGFLPEHTRHIETEGKRVGFVVLKQQPKAMLLDHLYIHPNNQGNGIGAVVLARIIEEANALGLPVRVGALRGSGSNRFYVRHGFTLIEEGDFDNYYIRPCEMDTRRPDQM